MTTSTNFKLGAAVPTSCATRALRFPAFFTRDFPSVSTATTRLHVMAPWGGRVGATYTQPLSPPAASGTVTLDTHDDQYVVDVLTPVTTTGGANATRARWLGFCVEIVCTQSLGNVAGAFRIMRWTNGPCAMLTAGGAPEFFTTYETLLEQDDSLPRGFAEVLATKCFRTPMISPNALNFVLMSPTSGWATVYGDATADVSAADVMGQPFAPIVIMATGASLPAYVITVRGILEVQPYPNTAYWRLARPLAPSSAEVFTKWWQYNRGVGVSKLAPAEMGYMRDAAGYVGVATTRESTGARAAHRATRARGRLADKMASHLPGAAAALLAAGAIVKARRGAPPRRLRRAKPAASRRSRRR